MGKKTERMDVSIQRIHGTVFPDFTKDPAALMDMLGDSRNPILQKIYGYIYWKENSEYEKPCDRTED